MATPHSDAIDLRALTGTREAMLYQQGGQFPVLASLPDGTILGVLRGGAGHVGLGGRVEVVRSRDGGLSWTPPAVVADSDRDDRNPALGVSPRGTLILAYHRSGNYDADGLYAPAAFAARGERPVEVRITRSHDGGLTWEAPYPLDLPILATGSPYGKIVALPDGTLLLALYGPVAPDVAGDAANDLPESALCSYLLRSRDDGVTWGEPTLIATRANETGLLALPGGDILSAYRGDAPDDRLSLVRSADGGRTWSPPVELTAARQHPADLIALRDGTILLAYGNRNPPYRIEGRISRDDGHSWSPTVIAFSGHLYGYNVAEPRPTDLGYPSSVVLPDGRGVTVYYYNPSMRRAGTHRFTHDSTFYSATDYYAIAVTWREDELLAALAVG